MKLLIPYFSHQYRNRSVLGKIRHQLPSVTYRFNSHGLTSEICTSCSGRRDELTFTKMKRFGSIVLGDKDGEETELVM